MLLIRSARPIAALCAAIVFAPSVAAAAPSKPAPRKTPAPKRDEAPVRAIAIDVNGEDLSRDPAPRVLGGHILVPVVRIFNAIGIDVQRDGNALIAAAPGRRIVIQIGSARATIDGRETMMESPAVEIGGATYVPLRFVADALGAQVAFDPKAPRVSITSLVVGRTPALEQHTPGGTTQIVGNVSAIDLNSAPESITVVRGSSERSIAITSDAKIVIQDVVTRTETPASLSDLHVGDAISVLLRADGRVDRVVGRFSSRAGTIAAVSGSQFVLGDGYVVTPDKATTILLNGAPATLSDLKAGDRVTVRLNPDTREKRQILAVRESAATPGPPGAAQITSVTVNAAHALKEGDAFTVQLNGTPGGRATFDIGSYVTGVPMTENAPGIYTGRYTVPAGVNFGHVSIYGHLTAAGVTAPRAEARQLVAVTTTPPQIEDIAPSNGAVVNNNRPSIYATFRSPTDVGIDPRTARIEVNGLDVTAAATRTESFITYTPSAALNDGGVTVIVSVADAAGNHAQRRFGFTVRTH